MSNILRHLHMGCGESLHSSNWCDGLGMADKTLPQTVKPKSDQKAKAKKASRRK